MKYNILILTTSDYKNQPKLTTTQVVSFEDYHEAEDLLNNLNYTNHMQGLVNINCKRLYEQEIKV